MLDLNLEWPLRGLLWWKVQCYFSAGCHLLMVPCNYTVKPVSVNASYILTF